MFTCWSCARVMRMTEGKLALAAPAGMAGSFLCPGGRVRGRGAGGREAWQEEEEEAGCGWCWSDDWLRIIPGGWRWCREIGRAHV